MNLEQQVDRAAEIARDRDVDMYFGDLAESFVRSAPMPDRVEKSMPKPSTMSGAAILNEMMREKGRKERVRFSMPAEFLKAEAERDREWEAEIAELDESISALNDIADWEGE